jgi:hypothetical protein
MLKQSAGISTTYEIVEEKTEWLNAREGVGAATV